MALEESGPGPSLPGEDKELQPGKLDSKPVETKPEAPAPVNKKPAAAAANTDAVVDQWFRERIYNSPISRNTHCWNYLQEVLAYLKQRLKGE